MLDEKIDYKPLGVHYMEECPDKERHINLFVIPIMWAMADGKEKCKVCGNPLYSEEDMKNLETLKKELMGRTFIYFDISMGVSPKRLK